MLLHGSPGTGKTTLASTIAQEVKTLLIDLPGEKGIKSIKGLDYSGNIDVFRPTSVQELDDLFWQMQTEDHPYGAVILESLSALQAMLIRFLLGNEEDKVRKIEKSPATMDQRKWGYVKEFITDTCVFWYGLASADVPSGKPIHVIFTSQSKVIEDDVTKEKVIYPDLSAGSRAISLATPDYIGYTYVEEEDTMDLTGDPKWKYLVRFGPHDNIATKLHENVDVSQKLPPVWGRKNRVTLPRFCKVLDIPLQ